MKRTLFQHGISPLDRMVPRILPTSPHLQNEEPVIRPVAVVAGSDEGVQASIGKRGVLEARPAPVRWVVPAGGDRPGELSEVYP